MYTETTFKAVLIPHAESELNKKNVDYCVLKKIEHNWFQL